MSNANNGKQGNLGKGTQGNESAQQGVFQQVNGPSATLQRELLRVAKPPNLTLESIFEHFEWLFKQYLKLFGHGLVDCLETELPDNADETLKWRHQFTRGLLISSLDSRLISLVRPDEDANGESASKVWQSLLEYFKPSGANDMAALKKDFQDVRMGPGVSLVKLIEKIYDLSARMNAIQEGSVRDVDKKLALKRGVCPALKPVIDILEVISDLTYLDWTKKVKQMYKERIGDPAKEPAGEEGPPGGAAMLSLKSNKGGANKKKKCKICKKTGHLATDCWSSDKNARKQDGQKKSSKSIRCYKCGEEGHVKRNCDNDDESSEGKEDEKKERAANLAARGYPDSEDFSHFAFFGTHDQQLLTPQEAEAHCGGSWEQVKTHEDHIVREQEGHQDGSRKQVETHEDHIVRTRKKYPLSPGAPTNILRQETWTVDTGCNGVYTSNPDNLLNLSEYTGTMATAHEDVSMRITGKGESVWSKDTYLVPDLRMNLLGPQVLAAERDWTTEIGRDGVVFKDQSGQVVTEGLRQDNGLYVVTTERNPVIHSMQGSFPDDDEDLYDADDDDGLSYSCDSWVDSCDGGDNSDDYDSDGAGNDHAVHNSTESWCHTSQLQHYAKKDGSGEACLSTRRSAKQSIVEAHTKNGAPQPPPGPVPDENAGRSTKKGNTTVEAHAKEEAPPPGPGSAKRSVRSSATQQNTMEAHTKEAPPGAAPTGAAKKWKARTHQGWPVHQMDMATAFRYGKDGDVYVKPPPGYDVPVGHCIRLNRAALYGLKQSPRLWDGTLHDHLLDCGFEPSTSDPCIYIKRDRHDLPVCIVAVFVDDLLIAAAASKDILQFKGRMHARFKMTDLGELEWYLGMRIRRDATYRALSISQELFVDNILSKYGMESCTTAPTPMAAGTLLSKDDCPEEGSAEERNMAHVPYRSVVGSLLYISICTRPDISLAVSKVAKFVNNPGMVHWRAAMRIVRYLKGTKKLGLVFTKTIGALTGYSDASWGDQDNNMKSTTGYLFHHGANLVSWATYGQTSTARSTVEAEYMALSDAAQEAVWLRRLLYEFRDTQLQPTKIFEDNQGAMSMARNPVGHKKLKHVAIRYHFLRELVYRGAVAVVHCPTGKMTADMLTKPLGSVLFERHRGSLGVFST